MAPPASSAAAQPEPAPSTSQSAASPEPVDTPPPAPKPGQSALKQFLTSHWTDQAARTTALLAVLAAVASSQYALQISRAILAQAEATDQWNHYSAKSIKKHLTLNQNETLSALALANPHLRDQLVPLIRETELEGRRYDRETKEIKGKADVVEREKRRHQKKGDRFQYAFVLLQAGVVLCTVASSSRKKMLWLLAVILGLGGLALLGNGYVLVI